MATIMRRLCTLALLASSMTGQAARSETLSALTSVQFVGDVPIANQIDSARKLGVKRVRLAVRWYEVERARGSMNWQLSDSRIIAVQRAGLTPVITLFGGNGAYPPGAEASGWTSDAIAGFARFSAATVARYGTKGPAGPIWYEIWNEPNTKTFWGRPPNPEVYAALAQHACTAIKAAAPTADVLAFGMEGWPVKDPYFVPAYNIDIYQQWAARAAAPDLLRCADGLSMHPYLASPEMILAGEPKFRAFLASHWTKTASPKIAFTEVGFAITDRPGHMLRPEDQAALDLRVLLIGAGQGRLTNLFMAVDDEREPAKRGQGYGLVGFEGTIRPSGLALQRILKAIGDYEIGGVAPIAGVPGAFRFTASRGSMRAQVLWDNGAPGSAQVPAGAHAVDLVTGAARPIVNGSIPISGAPVLVISQH